jgi:hypothetical protein
MQNDFGAKVPDNEDASGSERSEEYDWQQTQRDRAVMEERNERIRKRKWQRRGNVQDDESNGEEDEFGSDLSPDVKRSKERVISMLLERVICELFAHLLQYQGNILIC